MTWRDGAARATTLAIPGRWAKRALCAQADPDAWFPGKGHHELTQLAKRICARCPVRAAGLPPQIAATLRSRLRLIPEQEADR
jgi:hypothetical protein